MSNHAAHTKTKQPAPTTGLDLEPKLIVSNNSLDLLELLLADEVRPLASACMCKVQRLAHSQHGQVAVVLHMCLCGKHGVATRVQQTVWSGVNSYSVCSLLPGNTAHAQSLQCGKPVAKQPSSKTYEYPKT